MSDILAAAGFAALCALQWWLARAVWAASARRPARTRLMWRLAIGAMTLGLGLCYAFLFPEVGRRAAPLGAIPPILGAAALCYTILGAAAVPAYLVTRAARKCLRADTNPGRRLLIQAAGGVAMATPLAALGYGALIQRTDFRVREIDAAIPGLPAELDGYRILHLSDIHMGAFLSAAELRRAVDASNELRPHLAAITGDFISVNGDPLEECIRELARIRTDGGIFASLGNHERYARMEQRTARATAAAGIALLRRRARRLKIGAATLNLAGVDYQPMAERAFYLRGAGSLVAQGACNILLSHNPDVLPAAARQGWNLMLSGHTHGGQVALEILDTSLNPARFLTPYVYGLYRIGATQAYVTRGVGSIGIPVRLGAPPELALIRLRKA